MRVFSLLFLVFLVVVLTIGAAAFAYNTARNFVAESPVELPPPPQISDPGTPTAVPLIATMPTAQQPGATQSAAGTPSTGTAPVTTPTISALADPGRITVLLLGIDQRQGEKGPFHTDTIMVLSIDPIRKSGAMLSIPRDIYLRIPVYNKPDRINNANVIGDVFIKDYPGGGPALAARTVQSLIGVPIQHYILINFDVFTTVIDAVGPIRVCPDTPIHDDQYPDGSYGYITVDFPAGCQDLDSTKLLQYARVRHHAGDDFGRAKRQQEVVRAVRDKVLTLGGVSSLIGKAGAIWNSIKDNIKTDMSFEQMLQIAQIAQNIPKDNVHSAVITDRDGYLMPYTLPSGEQVFDPVYENIHDLVVKLFDAAPISQSNAEASAEAAAIVVLNGAGVDGLAKATADRLKSQGFNIIDAKNADQPGGYGRSVIKVYTGKMNTAKYLAQVLGLDGTVIAIEKDGPPGVDIELIAGKDLVP